MQGQANMKFTDSLL